TARASLKPLVFEGAVTAGGALVQTTEVENFPGHPEGIHGPALMMNIRDQAEKFGAEMVGEDIVAVDLYGGIKAVTDTSGNVHRAKAVIVATGSGYRRLSLPREDELSVRGVSWCAICDGSHYRDGDVVVVGGGDTAMAQATFLTRFARSVTVVHEHSRLHASQDMQNRAFSDDKVSFAFDSAVAEIRETGGKLTGITLRDVFTGTIRDLTVTGLFIGIGHDPRTELFKGQLELDSAGYLKVRAPSTRTSIPGVFGAGDAVDRVYRQAVTAAASGCAAALDTERYLAGIADENPKTVRRSTGPGWRAPCSGPHSSPSTRTK
ncbi:FAD-dependent oxidoreductase, partial [Streptomyces sp. NPDC093272]